MSDTTDQPLYLNEGPLRSSATFTLDVGGEGRHANAWNLNPSPLKTIGPDRGAPIPRWILGRAESIPLPDCSVEVVIVERTPLKPSGLIEIWRIVTAPGKIILRHAVPPNLDPHRIARKYLLDCDVQQSRTLRRGYWLQETVFLVRLD